MTAGRAGGARAQELPGLTIALLLAATATMLLPGMAAALGWEAGAAPWRLLTSQLAHWDRDQFLWDVLAIALLGGWAELRWPGPARRAVVLALVAVPALVALAHPGLAFRGLSGLACALAAAGAGCAWAEARRDRDPAGAALAATLLALLIAKTAYEALTADAVFARAAGWHPLPLAHAAGIACGLAACVKLRR